jgi:hypothetical protein
MKMEEGLLRYDRMSEMGWCFDMGYQVLPVVTGMTLSVRLSDGFQRGQLTELTDGRLTVTFGKRPDRSYTLEQHERYPAKVEAQAIQVILEED